MFGRFLAGLAAAFLLATGAAAKPLVVILAEPDGTLVTDLVTPYAILAESGAVDVRVVSPTADPVRLTPGRAWLAPQMTLAQLDRERPRGPDVIIIPAMRDEEDAERAAWLRRKAAQGARIMAICNGGRVLAATGLLDGRQATVHWFSQGRMRRGHPDVRWRQDVRYITDGPFTTTAGISAAESASLDLLRRLAGDEVMRETAARVRLPLPDPRHDGTDYRLTIRGMLSVIGNLAGFWRREEVAVPLTPGFDEHAFGAALEGWSRTYRSTAWATGAPATRSRHGLVIFRASELPRFERRAALPAGDVNQRTFDAIRAAHGLATARFVAQQFEHPFGSVTAWRQDAARRG